MKVFEIGCAEGGVLKAFLDRDCEGVGVELSSYRAELAKKFLEPELKKGRAVIICKNIYDESFEQEFKNRFDLIILKDVIEHIHDQDKLISKLKSYLNSGGRIFFGFPPWYMPFGGHQQMSGSKVLSKLPYYHLLPAPIYRGVLKLFGEEQQRIDELMEIKQTGISIERFEKILDGQGFEIDQKRFYLINPIYSYKFNLKVREQNKLVGAIPYVRDFLTTAVYYLVSVRR